MGAVFEDVKLDEGSSFEKFRSQNGVVLGHIHITKNREQVPIYQMDDSHLLNTIRLFAEKVAEASKAQRAKTTMLDVVMEQKAPGKKAAERLRDLISDGYPLIGRYVLEAVRRDLGDEAKVAAQPFYDTVSTLLGIDPSGAHMALPSSSGEDSEDSENGPSQTIEDAEIVE